MRWFILGTLTLVMVLAVHVSMAPACINDRESLQSEKEFKSSYIEKEAPAPQQYEPQPSPGDQLMVFGGSGIGAALLIGACVMGFVRPRRS